MGSAKHSGSVLGAGAFSFVLELAPTDGGLTLNPK